MKIINPIVITPSMVVSNVVEIYPTWSSTTSYSKGDRVVYNIKTYESLTNTNLNKTPDTSPTDWLVVGPSNCCAAFDTSYSTQTVSSAPIEFQITPNIIFNSVAVLNIDIASELTVQLETTTEGIVYSKTVSLDGSILADWYDYFFAPFDQKMDVVFTDIPPYRTGTLTITLDGIGDLKVGTIILGNVLELGNTQYGLSFGIKDYSVKQEDEFGNTLFVERNYARRIEPTVFIRNIDLRKIDRLLTEVRAKPTVFIPTEEEGYDTLITYGFLADWNIEIPYPADSLLRMDIKGLT